MDKHPLVCFTLPRVSLQAGGAVLEPPTLQPYSFAFPFPFPSRWPFKFCFLRNVPLWMLYQVHRYSSNEGRNITSAVVIAASVEYCEKLLYLLDACGSWAVNSSHVCQFFTALCIF